MHLDETWQVGLRSEKLSLARFQRNRVMGFGENAKKWVADALFFLWREPRTTSATFFGSISAKLPTNTCPGGCSRHMVSHSRKVSIKGSILPVLIRITWKPEYAGPPHLFSLPHISCCCEKLGYRGPHTYFSVIRLLDFAEKPSF